MTEPNETPGPEVLPPEPAPGQHAGSPAGPAPRPPAASPPWSSPIPPAGPRKSRLAGHKLALLGALAILLLAGAQGALWVRVLRQPAGPAAPDARVNAIDARLTRLEQRPVAQPPDLGPLSGRVAALEQKAGAAPGPVNEPDQRLQAIEARLAHLEQSPAPPPPDLASVRARLTALEQRPTPQGDGQPGPTTTGSSPSNARLASNPEPPSNAGPAAIPAPNPSPAPIAGPTPKPPDLAPLEARIAALEQKPPPTPTPVDTGAAQRVTADEARLAALEKPSQTPGQLADRTSRIARIQAAFIALSVGQPLGQIPDAPPALSRYATVAPPTEAALRLAFPAAAQAAMAAAHPPPTDQPLLQRLWAQAQDLVTVRQGDHVLLGDPAAGVLARAQTALDAGDLAAAVAALANLSGPQAQAFAPWLDQAHGLLAARAALATLAAQT